MGTESTRRRIHFPFQNWYPLCASFSMFSLSHRVLGVPFPKNFRETVRNIFKRLFRVYAHIYHSHFPKIVALGEEAHLNTSFKVRPRSLSCLSLTRVFSISSTLCKSLPWLRRRSLRLLRSSLSSFSARTRARRRPRRDKTTRTMTADAHTHTPTRTRDLSAHNTHTSLLLLLPPYLAVLALSLCASPWL